MAGWVVTAGWKGSEWVAGRGSRKALRVWMVGFECQVQSLGTSKGLLGRGGLGVSTTHACKVEDKNPFDHY